MPNICVKLQQSFESRHRLNSKNTSPKSLTNQIIRISLLLVKVLKMRWRTIRDYRKKKEVRMKKRSKRLKNKNERDLDSDDDDNGGGDYGDDIADMDNDVDDNDDTNAGIDDQAFEFATFTSAWAPPLPPSSSNGPFDTKEDVFQPASLDQSNSVRDVLHQISENIAKLIPSKSPAVPIKEDPNDMLFKFITSSIKDLSPDLQISCRAEMMTVLAKYQQKQLSEQEPPPAQQNK